MKIPAITFEAAAFRKLSATLQAAIATDFYGYELNEANRRISVMIELGGSPCKKFLEESQNNGALIVPAHLIINSLFVSANGSIEWLSAIVNLDCVIGIELCSQLKPARAEQRAKVQSDMILADQPQSKSKIILGIIDHGFPIFHSDLIQNDQSRILAIWDQDDNPDFSSLNSCPKTMGYGRQILKENINGWIKQSSQGSNGLNEDIGYEIADYPALRSRFTHGAMTSELFVGTKKPVNIGTRLDVEDKSTIIEASDKVFVQLPRRGLLAPSAGATNRFILDGLRYILGCAGDATEKIIVCIPYGDIQGPHDGTSMVERAMDAMIVEAEKLGKTLAILFPSGNTFDKAVLAKVSLTEKRVEKLAWNLPPDAETVMSAEIWMDKSGLPTYIDISTPLPKSEQIRIDLSQLNDQQIIIRTGGDTVGVVVLKDCGSNVLLMVQWFPPTLSDAAVLTFHQRWVFAFTAAKAVDKLIHCYLGWGGRNLGFEQRVRSSRWLALTDGVDITGNGSLLGTACGAKTLVIGACEKWGANRRAAYSGGGMPRGGTKTGVNCLAVSEENVWLPGIRCAGTRSGSSTRINGSSVAVPQAARAYAKTGIFKIKSKISVTVPSKAAVAIPGRPNSSVSFGVEDILDDAP